MQNEIGKSENKDLENFRQAVFYALSQIDIKITSLWNMLERLEYCMQEQSMGEEPHDE